jgi:hypothetical protein
MSRIGFVAALYIGALSCLLIGGGALFEQAQFWRDGRAGVMVLDGPPPANALTDTQFPYQMVDVVYRTDGGDVPVPRKSVSNEMLQSLLGGSEVPVQFLADNPHNARYYDDRGPMFWAWLVAGIGMAFLARFATRLLKREAGATD